MIHAECYNILPQSKSMQVMFDQKNCFNHPIDKGHKDALVQYYQSFNLYCNE